MRAVRALAGTECLEWAAAAAVPPCRDAISGGRFILGAPGPQVVGGLHAVPYAAPLARTREVIEICRMVWRREPLACDGEVFKVPLPAGRPPGGPPAGRPARDRWRSRSMSGC